MNKANKIIKLSFLGDALCDWEMCNNLNIYLGNNKKYNFLSCFIGLKSLLSKSDYVFANLETPISDNNDDLTNTQWCFNTPSEFAEALKKSGVDFVSTANNHCLDRGIEGIASTIDALDKIGLKHCGTYKQNTLREPAIISFGSLKIGVLSYTYGTNAFSNHNYLSCRNRKAVNLLQTQEEFLQYKLINCKLFKCSQKLSRSINKFSKLIDRIFFPSNSNKQPYEKRSFSIYRKLLLTRELKNLQKKSDIIVSLIHIGSQYGFAPTSYTLETTDFLLKHGANIVIANHEHVIHGSKYDPNNNKFTAYAIGNLISSAGILSAPFDRYANYSIAVHCYISTLSPAKIEKITFSILVTTIQKDGKLATNPVFDLIQEHNVPGRHQLIKESLAVAKIFSGIEHENLKEEFEIFNK